MLLLRHGNDESIDVSHERIPLQILIGQHAWATHTLRLAGEGLLQRGDVELLHLQEGGHDAARFFRVAIQHHVQQRERNDLPRQAEFIFQPAAGAFLPVFAQRIPIIVDLVLRIAIDLERDRLVELEMRAAIERDEGLSVELERNGHHRARGPAMNFMAGLSEI